MGSRDREPLNGTLLIDANVWVETADTTAPHHEACAALLRDRAINLTTVPTVITEAAWLIEDRLGPRREAAFLRLVTSPRVTIIDLTPQDWDRTLELVEIYASLGLGTVDASIIAVAERQHDRDRHDERTRFLRRASQALHRVRPAP